MDREWWCNKSVHRLVWCSRKHHVQHVKDNELSISRTEKNYNDDDWRNKKKQWASKFLHESNHEARLDMLVSEMNDHLAEQHEICISKSLLRNLTNEKESETTSPSRKIFHCLMQCCDEKLLLTIQIESSRSKSQNDCKLVNRFVSKENDLVRSDYWVIEETVLSIRILLFRKNSQKSKKNYGSS